MKTRNEQPSFKQKADSKTQNSMDNCLDNCSKDSRGLKSDMKSDLRLDNCSRKNQLLDCIKPTKPNKIELQS